MKSISTLAGLALASFSLAAVAAVSQAEADKLGKELTQVGAEAGPNAAGTIPKWTGPINFTDEQKKFTRARLQQLLAEAKKMTPDQVKKAWDAGLGASKSGAGIPDKPPFELPPELQKMYQGAREQIGNADKPNLVITAANMAQHADKLTEGHRALLKNYPTYKMVIYPTVRTAFFPSEIYAATRKNATSAKLEGVDNVIGASLGFAFPIPKSGAEVIWNHKLKFRGTAATRYNDQAIVKPDGSFKLTKLVEDVKFKYANLKEKAAADNKVLTYYLAKVVAPPRVAGQIYLVHEPFIGGRIAYIYQPSLGRINRAPDVGFDNPSPGTDNEQFNDQVDIFNGSLDRYDWKLVGKKEIYVPYNSYLINAPAPLVTYKDLLKPLHLNQDLARYELHRVWVVEATVKAGVRHQFKKRRFYVDEDSWSIAAVDCYDNRDQLWKFQEGHLLTAPFIPTVTAIPEVIYDLQSRRYFTTAMINDADQIINFEASFPDSYFEPASLKRLSQNN